jgi:UbiD family decarboxylase
LNTAPAILYLALSREAVEMRVGRDIPGWPFADLGEFLRFLEQRGHLVRVREPVDPYLEVSAIAQEVVRREGPALLFENVQGARFPLVINLFGSMERIVWALGREPSAIAEEFLRWLDLVRRPPTFRTLGELFRLGLRLWRSFPRTVRRAPVQAVVEAPNLRDLPVITCWPYDGGPFITMGLVVTHHPVLHTRNVAIYRLHVYDEKTTGMHWQSMKGGRAHYYEAERRGEPLEVAVVLGCDPVTMLCAVLPLPEEMDEILWSGWIRGRPVPLVRARTLRMKVPARAEFVLEGFVPPRERRLEGPFGDHFGHYSGVQPFPVFHVQAVTRRERPVYPSTVVGKPPQEDWFMGVAAGEMVGPLIRVLFPSVRRLWAYPETGFHHLLVVSVEERHPMEAMRVGLGLLGQGQLSLTKCLILVPPDVDPADWSAVLATLWDRFDPARHLTVLPTAPADTLDFTTPTLHAGSKVILNATDRVFRARPWPTEPVPPSELPWGVRATRVWPGGHLILQVHGLVDVRRLLTEALAHPRLRPFLWVWVVSPDVPLDDPTLLLWGIFTRFDPARDWLCLPMEWSGLRPLYSTPIGVDATWKTFYPAPLELPVDVVGKARQRVHRWGLEKWAPQGSRADRR